MISKIFYKGKMSDDQINNLKYDESFITYKISLLISQNSGSLAFEQIYYYLVDFYKPNAINKTQLKNYLNERFNFENKCFTNNEKITHVLNEIECINLNTDTSFAELLNKIVNYDKKEFEFLEIIYLFLRQYNIKELFIKCIMFNILCNIDYYRNLISSKILDIHKSYYALPIKYIIDDKKVLNILISLGIFSLEDLKSISTDILIIVNYFHLNQFCSVLDNLSMNRFVSLENKVDNFFSVLDDRSFSILDYRFGLEQCDKLTLDAIGKKFNLTRERIRQIEKIAIEKLNRNIDYLRFDIFILFNSISTEEIYITRNDLEKLLHSTQLINKIIFLLDYCDFYYVFNKKYDLIYDHIKYDIDDIITNILEKIDDYISVYEFNRMNNTLKILIKEKYSLYKDSIYIVKSKRPIDFVSKLVNESFPNGYHVGSLADYEYLKKYAFEKYTIENSIFPSQRAVVGLIERGNFCPIDKGTYLNRDLCPKIPEELLKNILDYINNQNDLVNYNGIYTQFVKEFNSLGIDNYYFVKGLIDKYLPNEYHKKRNYIQLTDEAINLGKAIRNAVEKFNYTFSIDDMMNLFDGVQEYTILNYFYQYGDIIWLSGKKFLMLEKLNIAQQDKIRLHNIINETFNQLHTKVVNTRKIWGKVKMMNNDIVDKYKIFQNYFDLYSLLSVLFKGEYSFKRPFISLDSQESLTYKTLIQDYASSLEQFNTKILNNYTNKMNMRGIQNYLEFLDDMSDSYVQINKDTMLKKDKFNLSDENLKEIANILSLLFTKHNEINTAYFKGYNIFPALRYSWNKYLLVGIIRTYLFDEYSIENTENNYVQTDFIIRRN